MRTGCVSVTHISYVSCAQEVCKLCSGVSVTHRRCVSYAANVSVTHRRSVSDVYPALDVGHAVAHLRGSRGCFDGVPADEVSGTSIAKL